MAGRYLIKLEYNTDKFCTFFVNLFERKEYNFVKLTEDIKANVRCLQFVTPSTIRIRFRDEDGDYVNLTYGDQEMFNEMFESSHPCKDRDYKKIYLKVSQLDSPVQLSSRKDVIDECSIIPNRINQKQVLESKQTRLQVPRVRKEQPTTCDLRTRFVNVVDPPSIDPFAEPSDDSDNDEPSPYLRHTQSPATTVSPLDRYLNKLNSSKDEQERKVAMLTSKLKNIEEKLSRAKSIGDGNVCGNCHLRLGHTAKRCSLETCTQVFDCGVEKFHPRQVNRNKMRNEIQKEKVKLQKMNMEIKDRQSAVNRLQKSLVSRIETKLLSEKSSDYFVGGMKNWRLLREDVHLIERYCKQNFNGKIPPKQDLTQILKIAKADDAEVHDSLLSQPKRRRAHENPAKQVLEEYGVNFPSASASASTISLSESHPSSASRFLNFSSNLLHRCEPLSKLEEEEQLDFVLKASVCSNDSLRGVGDEKYFMKTESVLPGTELVKTQGTTPTVLTSKVANDASEEIAVEDEGDAAMALLSLFKNSSSRKNT